MSDLIRREDAIEALYEAIRTELKGPFTDSMSLAVAMGNNIPSTEPERKRGKWIYEGKRGRFPACKCSICGHYENADWAMLQGANYCPNCGADMRDEDE